MSPAMMKKVGEMSLPVSIVMGAYTVFGPAVNTEIYNAKLIAADKAANAGGASGGNLGADPAQSLYTQAGAPGNGNGGRAGNAAYDGQFVSDILR